MKVHGTMESKSGGFMNKDEIMYGLHCCFLNEDKCDNCPMVDSDDVECREKLIQCTLYYLEPEPPIYKDCFPFCGNCKYALATTYQYCPKCGKEIKWDD